MVTATKTAKKPRGFQTLSPEERKRIASLGGTAAHANGFAHKFTSDEARAASRKGHESRRKNTLAKVIPTLVTN